METLEILTFVKYPPTNMHAGGGEITLWNTIRELSERGHSVHAITCETSEKLPEITNVRYYPTAAFKNTRPIDFSTCINWLIKTRRIKPDITHGFYAETFAANLYGRMQGIPVVQEIHYADLHPYTIKDILTYPKKASGMLWAAHLRFAKTAAKAADTVVTPSNYMKEKLKEVFGLPGEKISVVPVGVNKDVFSIKRNASDGKTINLLFVGRLVKEKGLDVLLNALNEVTANKDAYITVVGDGPLKKQYTELADSLGVSDRVSFRGFLTREGILSCLAEADVLVVPSLIENFPRITLEGMGAGIPVVASAVGGIPEQITDGVDGVLVPPGDRRELADAILKLSSEPEKMEKMGVAGREKAREFSIEKKITCFENLYESLLS